MTDRHYGPARWRIIAAFAAIYTVWGSTYLAIKLAIATLPPFLMAGFRFVLAGSVLYAISRLRGAAKPRPIHWRTAAILGFMLVGFGNGGVVWAEHRVPSGLTAVLVALVPLWTALLQWLRPGGERPSGVALAGFGLGFLGMVLLVSPGYLAGGGQVDPAGAGLLVVSSLTWAAASIYAHDGAPQPASPFLAAGMQMFLGGCFLLVAGTVTGEWTRLDLAVASRQSLVAFGYLVLVGSLVGYTAFVWLLKVSTPSRVATYAYVNPVVAVFLGWVFVGEPLTPRTLVAAGIIVAAVILITTFRSRGVHAPEPSTTMVPEVKDEDELMVRV